MLDSTKSAIEAVLRCDPSITEGQRRAALDALTGQTAAAIADRAPIDRVLKRETVAEILGVSRRTVSEYARRGLIKSVRNGEHGKRANGFSERSVRELLESRGAA